MELGQGCRYLVDSDVDGFGGNEAGPGVHEAHGDAEFIVVTDVYLVDAFLMNVVEVGEINRALDRAALAEHYKIFTTQGERRHHSADLTRTAVGTQDAKVHFSRHSGVVDQKTAIDHERVLKKVSDHHSDRHRAAFAIAVLFYLKEHFEGLQSPLGLANLGQLLGRRFWRTPLRSPWISSQGHGHEHQNQKENGIGFHDVTLAHPCERPYRAGGPKELGF